MKCENTLNDNINRTIINKVGIFLVRFFMRLYEHNTKAPGIDVVTAVSSIYDILKKFEVA